MLTQVKFRVLNFGWIVLAFQQNSLPQKKKNQIIDCFAAQ